MDWFGEFMLKGIGVIVVLTVIGGVLGAFIKDYDYE